MHLRRLALASFVLVSTAAAAQAPRKSIPLREALQLAARQGPDVAAARAQAAITRVGVERAYTAWKPDLSATGTFDHTSAPQQFDPGVFGLSGPKLTIVAELAVRHAAAEPAAADAAGPVPSRDRQQLRRGG